MVKISWSLIFLKTARQQLLQKDAQLDHLYRTILDLNTQLKEKDDRVREKDKQIKTTKQELKEVGGKKSQIKEKSENVSHLLCHNVC